MPLAKPNYAFQKRQRELAKKQKKEEKRLRKAEPDAAPAPEDTDATPDTGSEAALPGAPAEPAAASNDNDSKV